MDIDYIRELLLMIETGRLPDGSAPSPGADPEIDISREQAQKLTAYLDIICKNDLIKILETERSVYTIEGLTAKGRDFLDEIR